MNILNTLPMLVGVTGLYLLIRLRFFFVIHPGRAIKKICRGGKAAFSSLALALAGTLGVGNIVGVMAALTVGGAGSVFWLLVSALFSSVIKYAEVTLSLDSKTDKDTGIAGVIEGAFPRFGKGLGKIYFALCLGLSLFMGCALQAGAIADSARQILNISPTALLIPLLLFVAFVVIGGGKKIERATAIIIPLTTLVYIIMTFSIIFINIEKLPGIISLILSSAFSPEGAAGGILGFLFSRKLKEGFSKGMLSNEAGAGTSSFAHVRDSERNPCEGGLFGIAEVFFDTVLLCPLSALSILCGSPDPRELSGGMMGVCRIFEAQLGKASAYLLFFSVLAFAVSTVICWYYYGRVCATALFGNALGAAYFPIFLLFLGFGLCFSSDGIIYITDVLLFLMSIITLSAIIKGCGRVVTLTQRSGLLFKKSDSGNKGHSDG